MIQKKPKKIGEKLAINVTRMKHPEDHEEQPRLRELARRGIGNLYFHEWAQQQTLYLGGWQYQHLNWFAIEKHDISCGCDFRTCVSMSALQEAKKTPPQDTLCHCVRPWWSTKGTMAATSTWSRIGVPTPSRDTFPHGGRQGPRCPPWWAWRHFSQEPRRFIWGTSHVAGRHDTTSTGIVASTGNLPLVSTGGFDQTSKSPCESISVFCCFQLLPHLKKQPLLI